MKICDIVQFYSPLSGGVKRYIQDKSSYLTGAGVEHCVIVPAARTAIRRDSLTVFYEIRSPSLIGSRSYRMLMSERGIINTIRREKPDLIEVGDPYRAAWIGARYANEHNIPVVAYYHSDYPRALGRTVRKFFGRQVGKAFSRIVEPYLVNLYNRMDATMVASRRLYDVLDQMGVERLCMIPLGVDTKMFCPSESRENLRDEIGVTADKRILLYVGRLAREKNIRQLLAMQDRFGQYNRTHLLIIGDGEERKAVSKASRSSRDVSWLPYCSDRRRLAEFYSGADLFVHPGTSETFGLVSLEAQACGLRVLGIKGGGIEPTLEGEPAQIFARSPNPADLAEAVRRCLDLAETSSDKKARRACIVKRYSSGITYAKLLNRYDELIHDAKRQERYIGECCDSYSSISA